jgi:hypothetical protein
MRGSIFPDRIRLSQISCSGWRRDPLKPLSAFQGISVIEQLNRADRPQEPREGPHSRMRRRGASAGREQKGGFLIGHEGQTIGSMPCGQPPASLPNPHTPL